MTALQAVTAAILLAATVAGGQTDPARNLTFNGRPLTPEQMARLEALERYYHVRLPDTAYWYDNRSGAVGLWNGPGVGALPPGLELGGPMPANCSGGRTGVFVNGRELHPYDVQVLSQLGPVNPGRYWVDAAGYFGYENGPAVGNLIAMFNQLGASQQHRVYQPGELSGILVNPAGACTSAGNCAYKQ